MSTQKATLPTSHAKTAYGLLSEVRALILAEPLRYNQRCWLTREKEYPALCKFPTCGTVACVGGWVATLKLGNAFDWVTAGRRASDILGLDEDQESELFGEFQAGTHDAQTVAHAKAGAAHIQRFQQKYRRQLLAKKVL